MADFQDVTIYGSVLCHKRSLGLVEHISREQEAKVAIDESQHYRGIVHVGRGATQQASRRTDNVNEHPIAERDYLSRLGANDLGVFFRQSAAPRLVGRAVVLYPTFKYALHVVSS